jgi:retinol dehydrogenase-12
MPNFFYSQLFVTPQVPVVRLDGHTIIVTGANVGLGFEATKHFVRMGASKVILACRDVSKGKSAQQSIERSTSVAKGTLEVWQLDYSSYDSVKSFAERVNGLSRLDAVVQNAGINTRKWKMVEDNESHITVNVVSNLLLAHLILPKLRESAIATGQDGRLVIVGSEVYMWAKFQEKNSEKLFAALNSEQASNIGDRFGSSLITESRPMLISGTDTTSQSCCCSSVCASSPNATRPPRSHLLWSRSLRLVSAKATSSAMATSPTRSSDSWRT